MASASGGLRNLSIRGKLLLGFAVVIGLVGLGNLYGIVSVAGIAGQARFARDVALQKVAALTDVANRVKRIVDAAATAADVGIPEPLEQARSLRGQLDSRLDAVLAEYSDDPQLAADFARLGGALDEHLELAAKLQSLALNGQWSAFGAPRAELEDGQAALLGIIGSARDRAAAELQGALVSIARLAGRTSTTVAVATLLALVLALLVAGYLSGQIVHPLQVLLAAMKEAQAGDAGARAELDSGDETGSLARGFNAMVEELARHRNHLEEIVDERTLQLEVANQKLETELEVRQITEAALAENEQLLRQLINSVRAGILIVDAERGQILEINAFAAELIGSRREELVGRAADDYLPPAAGEDGAAAAENVRGELCRKDGGRIPILKSVAPILHQGRAHLIESFIDLRDVRG